MDNQEQHEGRGHDIRIRPSEAVPELVLIGKTEIQKALPALAIPTDPTCMNIYFGYKGSKQMQCQGSVYSLNGGEFFVTPPGVDHSTGPMPISKCAHYWLRIDLNHSRPFLGDTALEELRTHFLNTDVLHGRYSDTSLSMLRSLYDLSTTEQSPGRDIEMRLQLALFVLKLRTLAQNLTEHVLPPALTLVKAFLAHHLGEDLGVEDMANVAGYSSSSLTALFKKHEGISPAEYFTRLKMNEAKRLLLGTDHTVKQVSQELGYANERYFSTVFRKYYLCPPGKFRTSPDNHKN